MRELKAQNPHDYSFLSPVNSPPGILKELDDAAKTNWLKAKSFMEEVFAHSDDFLRPTKRFCDCDDHPPSSEIVKLYAAAPVQDWRRVFRIAKRTLLKASSEFDATGWDAMESWKGKR